MSEPFAKQSVPTQAVVRVGDGRGFVVEHRHQRFILTAAHCLPVDAGGRTDPDANDGGISRSH